MFLSELGNRLRMAREEKGISLEELQTLTKIQKKYLVGIEEGNYEKMPGRFYARAFIKQYAEAVGLQPDELFEEHRNEIPSANDNEVPEQLSRANTRQTVSNSKLFEWLPRIIITAIVVAVLFGIWYVFTNFFNTTDKQDAVEQNAAVDIKESNDIPAEPIPAEEEEETDEEERNDDDETDTDDLSDESSDQKLTAEHVSGVVTTYKLSNTDQFEIKITASNPGETWVKVSNNKNKTYFRGGLKDGASESIDLTNEEEVYIVAGNSRDTEIYVNDEKLHFELAPNEHVKQDIRIQFEKQ